MSRGCMTLRAEMTDTDYSDCIASVGEIIDEARNGRMFILVDHEDRENEGDLVIPAQMAGPDAVNFMAKHGRGLICLAMEGRRIDALGLPLMSPTNQSRHETAFTVSIEAREGVTTGISAHDRAHTIAVAIDPNSGPGDIATPGHVFPLRAREGGVLVRAGHTEAAVDIARLAGLIPAAVICEVMNDDGTMARLPDLVAFAQRHHLKIGTISDLIAYRLRHDNLVRETAADTITSMIGGEWEVRIFHDQPDGAEHLALIKGDIQTGGPVLVRMHVLDPFDDLLALHAARFEQVPDSMAAIAAEGRGALVILRDMSPGALSAKLRGGGASPRRLRQYGVGAQILHALGIRELVLLTNSPAPKVVGLEGYGITIVGTRPIPKRRG
jgi:3,4-dihydroxy 2-butanone 4-phosphate synthase/GTP cyclohydrolase II